MRVEESIEIARTPQEVWDFVADPANDPLWCPKVRSVEPAGPGRWEVVHRPIPLQPPSHLVLEHVEASPPERLVMREEDDASVFDVEYRLAPAADGGTRFMQVSEFEWKRAPRVLRALLGRGVRRDVCRQLRCLKQELEKS